MASTSADAVPVVVSVESLEEQSVETSLLDKPVHEWNVPRLLNELVQGKRKYPADAESFRIYLAQFGAQDCFNLLAVCSLIRRGKVPEDKQAVELQAALENYILSNKVELSKGAKEALTEPAGKTLKIEDFDLATKEASEYLIDKGYVIRFFQEEALFTTNIRDKKYDKKMSVIQGALLIGLLLYVILARASPFIFIAIWNLAISVSFHVTKLVVRRCPLLVMLGNYKMRDSAQWYHCMWVNPQLQKVEDPELAKMFFKTSRIQGAIIMGATILITGGGLAIRLLL